MKTMEPNNIDHEFKDKLTKLQGIPEGAKWNANLGWNEYDKIYGRKKHRKISYWWVAASFLLLIIATPVLWKYTNTSNKGIIRLSSDNKKKSQLVLGDGSKLWLNYNSSVNINLKALTIEADGEVYFELSKKSTFTINTPHGKFEATNCAFNLKTRKNSDEAVLTIASGKVTTIWTSDITLTMDVQQGEQATITPQVALTKTPNSDNNYLAWKTEELHFNNTPVYCIIDKVKDLYQVEIDLSDKEMRYCLVNSELKTISLDAIMNLLKNQLNFNIQPIGNKYLIKGKGC